MYLTRKAIQIIKNKKKITFRFVSVSAYLIFSCASMIVLVREFDNNVVDGDETCSAVLTPPAAPPLLSTAEPVNVLITMRDVTVVPMFVEQDHRFTKSRCCKFCSCKKTKRSSFY